MRGSGSVAARCLCACAGGSFGGVSSSARAGPRCVVITLSPEAAAAAVAMRKSCRVQRCCSAAGQPRGSERRFSFSEWVFGGGGVACCSALAPWGRCGAQGLCSAAGDALCPPTQGISLPSPPSPPLAPHESPQTFPVLSSDPQGHSAPPSPNSSSPILIPRVLFHPAPQCLPSVPLHPFSILHQVPCLPPPVPYSNSQCPLSPLSPPLLSLCCPHQSPPPSPLYLTHRFPCHPPPPLNYSPYNSPILIPTAPFPSPPQCSS